MKACFTNEGGASDDLLVLITSEIGVEIRCSGSVAGSTCTLRDKVYSAIIGNTVLI